VTIGQETDHQRLEHQFGYWLTWYSSAVVQILSVMTVKHILSGAVWWFDVFNCLHTVLSSVGISSLAKAVHSIRGLDLADVANEHIVFQWPSASQLKGSQNKMGNA